MGRLIEWTSPRAFLREPDDLLFGVVDVLDTKSTDEVYVVLCTVLLPPKPPHAPLGTLFLPPTGWAHVQEAGEEYEVKDYSDNHKHFTFTPDSTNMLLPAWTASGLSDMLTNESRKAGRNTYVYKRFDF